MTGPNSTASIREVWFQLLGSRDGKPYKGSNVDTVSVDQNLSVLGLRDAVHARRRAMLKRFTASQLQIFVEKDDGAGGKIKEALRLSHSIASWGQSDDIRVIVTVPQQEQEPHSPASPPSKRGKSTTLSPRVAADSSTWRELNDPLTGILHEQIMGPESDADVTAILSPGDDLRWKADLPEFTTIESKRCHYVGRDESMKSLLRVHFDNFVWRNMGEGTEPQFALIDSLSGMGKTSFALNFISLFKRCASEPCSVPISRRLQQILVNPGPDEKIVGSFAHDLLNARTLRLVFDRGSLFDSKKRHSNILKQLRIAIGDSTLQDCGISEDCDNCIQAIRKLPHPLFLIFDEIGSAFADDQANTWNHRSAFIHFVDGIAKSLLRVEGLYIVLCGRADFLWEVGWRSSDPDENGNVFKRINLNPIGPEYISQILDKTLKNSVPITELLKSAGRSPSDVAEDLYHITGGHPRSIVKFLLNGNWGEIKAEPRMVEYAKLALRRFPKAISDLWHQSGNDPLTGIPRKVNLTTGVEAEPGRMMSLEFLATRVHAWYSSDLKSTPVLFTPPVDLFLRGYFLPMTCFLEEFIAQMSSKWIDKSRAFEQLIVKFFQSVFEKPTSLGDERLRRFFPINDAKITEIAWTLDTLKRVDGKMIITDDLDYQSPITIPVSLFCDELCYSIENRDIDIYFPAPKSMSPNVFIVPSDGDFIIGIATKCFSISSLDRRIIMSEAKKFERFTTEVKKKLVLKMKFLLFIFASGPPTADCGLTAGNSACRIEHGVIEIIVIKLSDAKSRHDFFGLAVPDGTPNAETIRRRNSEMIERLIEYRQANTS